ncbi:hypothetical protein M8J77_015715 [Diaphorina citri]|nr:hypothetical protein M8J77_015715 [Diaphorina citri]
MSSDSFICPYTVGFEPAMCDTFLGCIMPMINSPGMELIFKVYFQNLRFESLRRLGRRKSREEEWGITYYLPSALYLSAVSAYRFNHRFFEFSEVEVFESLKGLKARHRHLEFLEENQSSSP